MVILFVFPTLTELQISACFSILGLPISLAMLCTHSMWDLSSPTRDGAYSPRAVETWSLNHWTIRAVPDPPDFTAGVPSLWNDDLRWGWCHNNRNKVHSKCNAWIILKSSPLPGLWKNCLPQKKLAPGTKKLGTTASLYDHAFKPFKNHKAPARYKPTFTLYGWTLV